MRSIIVLLVIGVLGIFASSPLAGHAQNATPDDQSHHPLIGAWIVDSETSDAANPPSFDIFMADGTLVNVGSDGTSIGVWEATGPNTAIFTFNGLMGNMGSEGMFVIRGEVEIATDGQSFTGTHAFSILTPDGTVVASYPGNGALGTRMVAEGPDKGGAPLPGFQSWTPASPEATPAA
jgi:hypothetical protein